MTQSCRQHVRGRSSALLRPNQGRHTCLLHRTQVCQCSLLSPPPALAPRHTCLLLGAVVGHGGCGCRHTARGGGGASSSLSRTLWLKLTPSLLKKLAHCKQCNHTPSPAAHYSHQQRSKRQEATECSRLSFRNSDTDNGGDLMFTALNRAPEAHRPCVSHSSGTAACLSIGCDPISTGHML